MQISQSAKFWLFLGISLLALLFGYLLGASSTPVAGVFITASIGAVASVGSLLPALFSKTKIATSASGTDISTNAILKLTGQIIFFFALSLIGGTYLGAEVRWYFTENDKNESSFETDSSSVFGKFPWNEHSKPRNGQEAIDWCMTQNMLVEIGLSEAQIKEIYQIYRFPTAQKDSVKALASGVVLQQTLPARRNVVANIPGSGGGSGNFRPVPSPEPNTNDRGKILKPIPSKKPTMQDWQKPIAPSQNFKKYESKKQ